MENKKGLSDVITTILIILFALAAVVIIWGVIRFALLEAGDVTQLSVTAGTYSVVSGSVMVNETNTSVGVVVRRDESGGELPGFYIVLEDLNKNTASFQYNYSLKPFETRPVFVDYSGSKLVNIDKIYIAPILAQKDGTDRLGPVTLGYEVLGGVKSYCGDGKIEYPETCEGAVSATCSAVYPSEFLDGQGILGCISPGIRGQCTYDSSKCVSKFHLISYYRFEGPVVDGTSLADSWGGNVLASYNYTADVANRPGILGGRALLVSGANQSVYSADAGTFNFGENNFTVSLWVNRDQYGLEQVVFSKGWGFSSGLPGYNVAQHGDIWKVYVNNGTLNTGLYLTSKQYSGAGTWNHVALIRAGRKLSLYVNGILQSKGELPENYKIASGAKFTLGSGPSSTSRVWKGKVDEVMVYDRELNSQEVRAIYESQKP